MLLDTIFTLNASSVAFCDSTGAAFSMERVVCCLTHVGWRDRLAGAELNNFPKDARILRRIPCLRFFACAVVVYSEVCLSGGYLCAIESTLNTGSEMVRVLSLASRVLLLSCMIRLSVSWEQVPRSSRCRNGRVGASSAERDYERAHQKDWCGSKIPTSDAVLALLVLSARFVMTCLQRFHRQRL